MTTNLPKMRAACLCVQGATAAIAILISLGFAWALLHLTELGVQFTQTHGLYLDAPSVSSLQKFGLAITISMPLIPMLLGLWRLFKLFHLFANGHFFCKEVVKHLMSFSVMLFITVILSVLAHSLFSIILTFNNPTGLRALSVSFGSAQLTLLLQAGVFTVIAWVFTEGVKINDENAEFI